MSGAGQATIRGGTLNLRSSFSENVYFVSAARWNTRTGAITGLRRDDLRLFHSGADRFDLRDIAFKSASEASFSGDRGGGELTVTDGTHTAHIYLAGDYAASTFVASSDGHGGTMWSIRWVGRRAQRQRAFAGAMAAFAPLSAAGEHATFDRSGADQPLILAPRAHLA